MPIPLRIKQLIRHFSVLKVDAVLVTHPTDIRYLTGYPAQDAWLLVTPKSAFYITDGRYIEEVKRGIHGVSPVKFTKTLYGEVASLCGKAGVRALGIDEAHMTIQQHKRLKSFCSKKITIKPSDGCVEALRSVKDASEIKFIREALALNLQAYVSIRRYLKPGVREMDILEQLEVFIRKHGVKFAFDPIIASGPNSAYPHARVTRRKLCHKEPVLIDLGMDVKGYKSDLTRMFFLDTMPAAFREDLSIVRDAQHEAFKVIRPGVQARDVDAAARDHLRKHGVAECFTHSLGHGVGLDVHESPRIAFNSNAVLKENMLFTVEPGVYFPGKYGIRLEEMVLVTKKGCEVLSGDHDQ